ELGVGLAGRDHGVHQLVVPREDTRELVFGGGVTGGGLTNRTTQPQQRTAGGTHPLFFDRGARAHLFPAAGEPGDARHATFWLARWRVGNDGSDSRKCNREGGGRHESDEHRSSGGLRGGRTETVGRRLPGALEKSDSMTIDDLEYREHQ